MQEIIERLKEEARNSWHGTEGERRAERLGTFLKTMLPEYASVLGLSEAEILTAIEGRRTYTAINYYQPANFPSLKDVRVFDTQADALAAMPSKRFRCPACGGTSTDPYECNSGESLGDKTCDWKSWGLLRSLGKGFRFTIKEGFLDQPRVDEIFMPIELEQPEKNCTCHLGSVCTPACDEGKHHDGCTF